MARAYKNVVYDKFTKSILVRYAGSSTYEKIPYEKDYWVQDPTGKSKITDLHGIPMVRRKLTDKNILATLKSSGLAVAESDFREEVKWMHDVYDREELHGNINDWNIGFYDIEVAAGPQDSDDHEIHMKETTLKIGELKKRYPKTYKEIEVYDERKKCWCKFKDSYYNDDTGFPKPEEAAWPINLITVYSSQLKDYYTWSIYPDDIHEDDIIHHHRGIADELEMLKDFLKWFHEQNFDIITGWNSILFDMPYIVNRIKRLRAQKGIKIEYENLLSPLGKRPVPKNVSDKKLQNDLGVSYDIPGLIHFDYMELWKTFATHPPMPCFSLQTVSMFVLEKGKLEYEGTINTVWQDPKLRQQFGRYNVIDVGNNKEIEDKCQIFPLVIDYAYDCLVTVDKVYNKVPTTEGYMLRYMHTAENMVMNDRADHHEDWWRNTQSYIVYDAFGNKHYQNCDWEQGKYEFEEFGIKAGYCYDFPGRWEDCFSFDITSSYPHHIMQFNISPEVKVINPTKEQIESGEVIPSDVACVGFRRTKNAILPTIVKKVFDERKEFRRLMKEAKKNGDEALAALYNNRQGIKKIIINSMYGVCLSGGFHLYDIDCARSITRCARVTLRDWLKKYLDKYYVSTAMLADVQKYFNITLKNTNPIKIQGRECVCVHADTDSLYFCIHELKERLKEEGLKIETEDEHRDFFAKCEAMFQDFFVKVLEIRAKASHTENKINYNRENIFSNMFCFAKKLYIGNVVVDAEGELYSWKKPKHKIMGVPIKRSDMPEFCKEAAEELAFAVCDGQDYGPSNDFILQTFAKFKEAGPNEVCATKSVSEYTKYVTESIENYVANGLHFDKGQVFNAKCALAYNYIIAKYKLPYMPIMNGNKFNYVAVKSKRFPQIEAIAFIGQWPKEFDQWFEIDYETMFQKTFIPLFESMFRVAKWIGPKETINVTNGPGLADFFC